MLSRAKFLLEIVVINAKCRFPFREDSEHILTSLSIIGFLIKGKKNN